MLSSFSANLQSPFDPLQQEDPQRPVVRRSRRAPDRGGEIRGRLRPGHHHRHHAYPHLPDQQRPVQWVSAAAWCPGEIRSHWNSLPPSAVAITQGGAIQLASNGTDGVQGLQTLTMANSAQPGTTILQYAQTSDGQQILVPSNQVVVQGELHGQICSLQGHQVKTSFQTCQPVRGKYDTPLYATQKATHVWVLWKIVASTEQNVYLVKVLSFQKKL